MRDFCGLRLSCDQSWYQTIWVRRNRFSEDLELSRYVVLSSVRGAPCRIDVSLLEFQLPLQEQNKQHECRERSQRERHEPDEHLSPPHAGLIEHAEIDPHDQFDVVHGHRACGVNLQAAGRFRPSPNASVP